MGNNFFMLKLTCYQANHQAILSGFYIPTKHHQQAAGKAVEVWSTNTMNGKMFESCS